jgi:hypothetical protein
MNLDKMQYINLPTASLGYGSFLNQEDLQFYTEGITSLDFPFGKSKEDYVKFEVYNLDGTPITSSMIYSNGTYTPYTKSFYDAFNQYIEYDYLEYTSDYVITGTVTQSLFFDVRKEFDKLGIQGGNYKIYAELGRNIVGNERDSQNKLIINTISSNRSEITIIPKATKGSKDQINLDFSVFSNGKVFVKEVIDDLIYRISKPELFKIYEAADAQNKTGSADFKFNYSFKKDIDAICFLTDVYYGVKKGNYRTNGQIATNDILGIYDQFKNWLYTRYNTGTTFQEIKDYYYSLFSFVIDHELNRLVNTKPQSYSRIIEFLQTIFYNAVFYPAISRIEEKHNIDLSGYFKYYLNFSDGTKISITNRKVLPSADPKFYDSLALKLIGALPTNIGLGTDVWITCDFGFLPLIQNVYYFSAFSVNTIPLRGPNFLIKVENEGNSTETLSMEQLLGQTGSLQTELEYKIEAKNSGFIDTTDYRSFENFVNFSSADLRVKAFASKKNQIEALYSEIQTINAGLTLNPNDTFYLKEKSDANEQIDQLEASMDGYEKFLYKNPAWYEEHAAIYDGYTSASLYDKNNLGSLINNLPQFMIEDAENNADYIKFVGMVGHFFDNVSLAAKQYTAKNQYSSSPNSGISMQIVGDMLRSLGWDAEISKENLPLLLSSFANKDFDRDSVLYSQSRSLSEEERNQIIWKRILNTLPFIYKTKGTEAALNALISCFGIPKNIIKIKEYGGIQSTSDLVDKSLYIIEDVKYEPYFSGSGEYFKFNWTGSAKTIEFNFRFDPNKTHAQGNVFRLVNCSDYWVVGAVREKGNDWGRLFFSIDDGFGNVKTSTTNRIPMFDGNSYHAMIRRNYVVEQFLATASINEYPTRYDLILQKSEDDRVTYSATSSVFLSGSYNNSFESGQYLYIGNYNQSTASLSMDPEAFFGNIDDIRIWENPLSNERFSKHTLSRNSYDLETPQEMVEKNLYRVSFERPLDLYDSSGKIELNNLAFRSDFPTFEVVNFPQSLSVAERENYCEPSAESMFPYQFSRYDVRFTMNLPDYGSNKFRNNKINYVEQELLSNLSSETRASYKTSELLTVDANKLGIFFSPAEIQNTEIIKFFGEFPLNDLIGNPADVYQRTYSKFETFKKIYYDQGFGSIDFTFFMNIIRFYFDKSMFKYIKSVVPARAKLVDGMLIEPNILERPKLQMRPLTKENIAQKTGVADGTKNITAVQDPKKIGTMKTEYRGSSLYSDVNQVCFPIEDDKYGFSVYSDDGITYYNDQFYRADVVKYKKKYQVYSRYVSPNSQLTEDQIINDNRGKTQTIERTYTKLNLAKLVEPNKYPMTASFYTSLGGTYFSGSLYFDANLRGWNDYTMSFAHNVVGVVSGAIAGLDTIQNPGATSFIQGNIFSPGIMISGSLIQNGKYVVYSGLFDTTNDGRQLFEGTIYGESTGNTANDKTAYNLYFLADNPTGSLLNEFVSYTSKELFGPLAQSLAYRKIYSMENYPSTSTLLQGYRYNHYRFSKKQFSQKELNGYQQNLATNSQINYKWKKSSQNKKTTVDPKTGLLDNSEAVIVKTI